MIPGATRRVRMGRSSERVMRRKLRLRCDKRAALSFDHGGGEKGVSFRPSGAHLGSELRSEALLQGPNQSGADGRVVFFKNAITPQPGPKRADDRQEGIH